MLLGLAEEKVSCRSEGEDSQRDLAGSRLDQATRGDQ